MADKLHWEAGLAISVDHCSGAPVCKSSSVVHRKVFDGPDSEWTPHVAHSSCSLLLKSTDAEQLRSGSDRNATAVKTIQVSFWLPRFPVQVPAVPLWNSNWPLPAVRQDEIKAAFAASDPVNQLCIDCPGVFDLPGSESAPAKRRMRRALAEVLRLRMVRMRDWILGDGKARAALAAARDPSLLSKRARAAAAGGAAAGSASNCKKTSRRYRMFLRMLCGPTIVIDCGRPPQSMPLQAALAPEPTGAPRSGHCALDASDACGVQKEAASEPAAKRARTGSHLRGMDSDSSATSIGPDSAAAAGPDSAPTEPASSFEWEVMMKPAEQRSLSQQIVRCIQALMRAPVSGRIVVCGLSAAGLARMERHRAGQAWPVMLTEEPLEGLLGRMQGREGGGTPGGLPWEPALPLPTMHPARLLLGRGATSSAGQAGDESVVSCSSAGSTSGSVATSQRCTSISDRLSLAQTMSEQGLALGREELLALAEGSQRPWPPRVGCARHRCAARGRCALCAGQPKVVYLVAEGDRELDVGGAVPGAGEPSGRQAGAGPAEASAALDSRVEEGVPLETGPCDVLIIGGLVDRNRYPGAALRRAQALGLLTARLPLDGGDAGTAAGEVRGAQDGGEARGAQDGGEARGAQDGGEARGAQDGGEARGDGASGSAAPRTASKRRPLTTVHVVQLLAARLSGESWAGAQERILPRRH